MATLPLVFIMTMVVQQLFSSLSVGFLQQLRQGGHIHTHGARQERQSKSCLPPTHTQSDIPPRATIPPQSANHRSVIRSSTQSSVGPSLSQSLSASSEQSHVGTATVLLSLSVMANHSLLIDDSFSFVWSSLFLEHEPSSGVPFIFNLFLIV
jgi:hypothetical protein